MGKEGGGGVRVGERGTETVDSKDAARDCHAVVGAGYDREGCQGGGCALLALARQALLLRSSCLAFLSLISGTDNPASSLESSPLALRPA